MSFKYISLFSLQSTMSFFHVQATDRPNRWQLILFVPIQCNTIYLSATGQCIAINCYPWHATPTLLHIVQSYLGYLMHSRLSLSQFAIHRLKYISWLCNIFIIVTFELAIVQKAMSNKTFYVLLTVHQCYYAARAIVVVCFVVHFFFISVFFCYRFGCAELSLSSIELRCRL